MALPRRRSELTFGLRPWFGLCPLVLEERYQPFFLRSLTSHDCCPGSVYSNRPQSLHYS
jgi:hypothetical protein